MLVTIIMIIQMTAFMGRIAVTTYYVITAWVPSR